MGASLRVRVLRPVWCKIANLLLASSHLDMPSYPWRSFGDGVVLLATVAVALKASAGLDVALPSIPIAWRLTFTALMFTLLITAVGLRRPLATIGRTALGLAREALTGWALFVIGGAILTTSHTLPSLGFVFLFLIPAFSEELVFRVVVPRTLARYARCAGVSAYGARIGGIFLAQLSFAAAHTIRGGDAGSVGLAETGRLIAAGIMYAVLLRRGGLGLTAGAHGLQNASLFQSDTALTIAWHPAEAILWIGVGTLMIASEGHRARVCTRRTRKLL